MGNGQGVLFETQDSHNQLLRFFSIAYMGTSFIT